MKVKSKVRKMGENRKVIEIPKAVSDNFEINQEVEITKVKKCGKMK